MFGIQYLCVIIAVHANLFVWFDPGNWSAIPGPVLPSRCGRCRSWVLCLPNATISVWSVASILLESPDMQSGSGAFLLAIYTVEAKFIVDACVRIAGQRQQLHLIWSRSSTNTLWNQLLLLRRCRTRKTKGGKWVQHNRSGRTHYRGSTKRM
jgi:hypothetical protein